MRQNSRNRSQTDSLAQNLKFQSHYNFEGVISFKETFRNAKNLDNGNKNKAILHKNITYLNSIIYFMLFYKHLPEKNVFHMLCEPIKHANFSEH